MQPNLTYEIRRILPGSRRHEAMASTSISMGISMDNPQFQGENLNAVLQWISLHFKNCLIFIGDHLYPYTLAISNSFVSKIAPHHISVAVAELEVNISAFAKTNDTQFAIVRLSDLARRESFENYKNMLINLHDCDSAFRASINRSANSYIQRKAKRSALQIGFAAAFDLSVKYLIDEVAFYCLLTSEGWTVEAYPGPEIPVLKEIIDGNILNAPKLLKDRIFIELKKTRQH